MLNDSHEIFDKFTYGCRRPSGRALSSRHHTAIRLWRLNLTARRALQSTMKQLTAERSTVTVIVSY